MSNEEIIYEKTKRHYNYVYWAKKGAPKQQHLWWQGYFECLCFMLEMMRALKKGGQRK